MERQRGAAMRAESRRSIAGRAVGIIVALVVMATTPGTAASAGPTRPAEADRCWSCPVGPGVPVPGARYSWPLWPPPAVVRPFGAPENPYGPGHRGVDLAAETGRPVLAARAGTVVFAGRVAGSGVVAIDHDDGLRTTYEPVVPAVEVGDRVAAGAVIGTVAEGHLGCPAACLHWGVRRDRLTYVDPLVLLRPRHVRLLPVPDPWPDEPVADPPARGLRRRRARRGGRAGGRPAGCGAGRPVTP